MWPVIMGSWFETHAFGALLTMRKKDLILRV
jgi:hypothetical protein